jgi:hypothetical protein
MTNYRGAFLPDCQHRKLIVILIAQELLLMTNYRSFLPDCQQRKLVFILIAQELLLLMTNYRGAFCLIASKGSLLFY